MYITLLHNTVLNYVMDYLTSSLDESSISTVKTIQTFLRLYDSQVFLEPRIYEVSMHVIYHYTSITIIVLECVQVPKQRGVDCGVHTMHNVGVAARVSQFVRYCSRVVISTESQYTKHFYSTSLVIF